MSTATAFVAGLARRPGRVAVLLLLLLGLWLASGVLMPHRRVADAAAPAVRPAVATAVQVAFIQAEQV